MFPVREIVNLVILSLFNHFDFVTLFISAGATKSSVQVGAVIRVTSSRKYYTFTALVSLVLLALVWLMCPFSRTPLILAL